MPLFRAIASARRSRKKDTSSPTPKRNIFSRLLNKIRKTEKNYSPSKSKSRSPSTRSRSNKSRSPSNVSLNDIGANLTRKRRGVRFNTAYTPKSTKCSSGKGVTFFKKTDNFHVSSGKLDYLEYAEDKNALDCPDELPHIKYEKGINEFCCSKEMVTKQELFDYINDEIEKFIEKYSKTDIDESDSLKILISRLLERRDIFVKWIKLSKKYNKRDIIESKEQMQKDINGAEDDVRNAESALSKWKSANKDRPVDKNPEKMRDFFCNQRVASLGNRIFDTKKILVQFKKDLNDMLEIEKYHGVKDGLAVGVDHTIFKSKVYSPDRKMPFASLDEWVEYMNIDKNAFRYIVFKTMGQTSSNFNVPVGTSDGEEEDPDEVAERRREHIERTLERVNQK